MTSLFVSKAEGCCGYFICLMWGFQTWLSWLTKSSSVNQLLLLLLLSFVMIFHPFNILLFSKALCCSTHHILCAKYPDLLLLNQFFTAELSESCQGPQFLFVERVGGMFCPVVCCNELAGIISPPLGPLPLCALSVCLPGFRHLASVRTQSPPLLFCVSRTRRLTISFKVLS